MQRTHPTRNQLSVHDAKAPDVWQPTRVETALATQIQHDEADYLAADKEDVGRQTSANQHELFVSCDATLALRQQFEHLAPEFIAVHDLATVSARKLIAGIAEASQLAVQSLTIRRQGYGTALARVEFIELASAEGRVVRMYATETEGDTAARHGIARTLLAFSRLAVIIVGELPAHAIASALRAQQDQVHAGPWSNRELLLLPLGAGSSLSTHGAELGRATGINVRTTPQVLRPADAWGYIDGTWGHLRAALHPPAEPAWADTRVMSEPTLEMPSTAAVPPSAVRPATRTEPRSTALPSAAPARASPNPLAMRPMPTVASAESRAAAPASPMQRYVQRLSELPGMASCCVFDVNTGLEVAHAGASPDAADLAMHGKALLASMSACSRRLGLGHTLPEAAITLGSHHLLLRAVPGHAGLALHAAIDKSSANLTLLRLQVQRLDTTVEPDA